MMLWIIRIIMFLLSLLLALFILYFYHGSVEMFPTDEQQEKVRIFSGVAIFFLLGIEYLLFMIQKRIKGTTKD